MLFYVSIFFIDTKNKLNLSFFLKIFYNYYFYNFLTLLRGDAISKDYFLIFYKKLFSHTDFWLKTDYFFRDKIF